MAEPTTPPAPSVFSSDYWKQWGASIGGAIYGSLPEGVQRRVQQYGQSVAGDEMNLLNFAVTPDSAVDAEARALENDPLWKDKYKETYDQARARIVASFDAIPADKRELMRAAIEGSGKNFDEFLRDAENNAARKVSVSLIGSLKSAVDEDKDKIQATTIESAFTEKAKDENSWCHWLESSWLGKFLSGGMFENLVKMITGHSFHEMALFADNGFDKTKTEGYVKGFAVSAVTGDEARNARIVESTGKRLSELKLPAGTVAETMVELDTKLKQQATPGYTLSDTDKAALIEKYKERAIALGAPSTPAAALGGEAPPAAAPAPAPLGQDTSRTAPAVPPAAPTAPPAAGPAVGTGAALLAMRSAAKPAPAPSPAAPPEVAPQGPASADTAPPVAPSSDGSITGFFKDQYDSVMGTGQYAQEFDYPEVTTYDRTKYGVSYMDEQKMQLGFALAQSDAARKDIIKSYVPTAEFETDKTGRTIIVLKNTETGADDKFYLNAAGFSARDFQDGVDTLALYAGPAKLGGALSVGRGLIGSGMRYLGLGAATAWTADKFSTEFGNRSEESLGELIMSGVNGMTLAAPVTGLGTKLVGTVFAKTAKGEALDAAELAAKKTMDEAGLTQPKMEALVKDGLEKAANENALPVAPADAASAVSGLPSNLGRRAAAGVAAGGLVGAGVATGAVKRNDSPDLP